MRFEVRSELVALVRLTGPRDPLQLVQVLFGIDNRAARRTRPTGTRLLATVDTNSTELFDSSGGRSPLNWSRTGADPFVLTRGGLRWRRLRLDDIAAFGEQVPPTLPPHAVETFVSLDEQGPSGNHHPHSLGGATGCWARPATVDQVSQRGGPMAGTRAPDPRHWRGLAPVLGLPGHCDHCLCLARVDLQVSASIGPISSTEFDHGARGP